MRTWLKELREKMGLSQQNVADKLEMTQQYYNLIENGERKKELDVALVLKLASIFNLTTNYIIEREKERAAK